VLTAAREGVDGRGHVEAAVASMLTLNRHASHLAREAGAHAMTDVTGFGLLGHAREMASRGDVRVVIDSQRVRALPGALEYAARGITTSGALRNREGLAGHVEIAAGVDTTLEHLLFDPQTSGGLLIALAGDGADALVARLAEAGLAPAIVGRVEAGEGVQVV
jgi:selenide,water dikinase